MGTDNKENPVEEKGVQAIHSGLYLCDSKLVWLVPVLFFPMNVVLEPWLFHAIPVFYPERKEGRKKRGKEEGGMKGRRKVGGREGKRECLFISCYLPLQEFSHWEMGNLKKWIEYKYCWSKYLQPITNLCHSNIYSFSICTLSI